MRHINSIIYSLTHFLPYILISIPSILSLWLSDIVTHRGPPSPSDRRWLDDLWTCPGINTFNIHCINCISLRYLCGFFFWLDAGSTVTLILDLTYVGTQRDGADWPNSAIAKKLLWFKSYVLTEDDISPVRKRQDASIKSSPVALVVPPIQNQ